MGLRHGGEERDQPRESLSGDLLRLDPGGVVAGELQHFHDGGQGVSDEVRVELADHQAVALEVNLPAGDVELVALRRGRGGQGGGLLVPGAHLREVGDEPGQGGPDNGLDAGVVVVHREEGDDVGPRLPVLGEGERARQSVSGDPHTLSGEFSDDAETFRWVGVEVAVDHQPLYANSLGSERGGVHGGKDGGDTLLLVGKTLEARADHVEETVEGEVVASDPHEFDDVRTVLHDEDHQLDLAGSDATGGLVAEPAGVPRGVPGQDLDTAVSEVLAKALEVVRVVGDEMCGFQ